MGLGGGLEGPWIDGAGQTGSNLSAAPTEPPSDAFKQWDNKNTEFHL